MLACSFSSKTQVFSRTRLRRDFLIGGDASTPLHFAQYDDKNNERSEFKASDSGVTPFVERGIIWSQRAIED